MATRMRSVLESAMNVPDRKEAYRASLAEKDAAIVALIHGPHRWEQEHSVFRLRSLRRDPMAGRTDTEKTTKPTSDHTTPTSLSKDDLDSNKGDDNSASRKDRGKDIDPTGGDIEAARSSGGRSIRPGFV